MQTPISGYSQLPSPTRPVTNLQTQQLTPQSISPIQHNPMNVGGTYPYNPYNYQLPPIQSVSPVQSNLPPILPQSTMNPYLYYPPFPQSMYGPYSAYSQPMYSYPPFPQTSPLTTTTISKPIVTTPKVKKPPKEKKIKQKLPKPPKLPKGTDYYLLSPLIKGCPFIFHEFTKI
jgi:hypothetical protein